MHRDAGAGGEVVEHVVGGTGGIGWVRTGARARVPVPPPASHQTRVSLLVIVADTATLVVEELLTV